MVSLEDVLTPLLALLIVASLLVSIQVVRTLSRPRRPWRETLESRFLWGVPWGTLLVFGFVLAFYLVVQDGITDFDDPVVVPYRAWSYYYPLGMLSASFSHGSSSHLIGNLVGAAVVAPIAEYAWGHYPDGRERAGGSTDSRWDDPRTRAFVIFPVAVLAVGLVTSVFALGPVIGFSGVVFAFAGFAIVRYPMVTILATLGAQGALMTIYRALQTPILYSSPTASPPSAPSWATIAIQGHALGFFIGLLACILVLERRGYRPDPLRLWLALLFFGFSKSLWAIYWFGGENLFILFRAPGVIIVILLAVVVTVAVTGPGRPLLEGIRRSNERRPDAGATAPPSPSAATVDRSPSADDSSRETEPDGSGNRRDSNRSDERDDLTSERSTAPSSDRTPLGTRRVAFLTVLVVVALISGVAVPTNLFVIDGEPGDTEAAITIEDYTIEYVEGVQNELVGVVDVSAFGLDTQVESSGVIVSSSDRQIWQEAVTAQRLEFTGSETVTVGGPGWRESVHVEREGWTPVGNDSAYQVWLQPDGEDRRLAFASDPVSTSARIDGNLITIVPEDEAFLLEVESDDDVSRVPVPAENESVTANGLEFEHDDGELYVSSNGTVVQIASEETYN